MPTTDMGALSVINGELPRRALDLALELAKIHRAELIENWRLCRENRPPEKIDPLV